MNISKLYDKALNFEFLTLEEGNYLYKNAPLAQLMSIADKLRKEKIPENKVGWIIDRNLNITNVCIARCKFCNFHCTPKSEKAYTLELEAYKEKIDELFELGGEQLLLQGGLNPDLGLEYYCRLFSGLKRMYPNLKLHALGPPEIVFIAKSSGLSYKEVLEKLMDAGLDSLPGAGAEILADRVRTFISPGKCSAQDWLDVMRQAHILNLPTSATMMFGHIETPEERLQHLISLRELQREKPDASKGFITFVPWPFQDSNTKLKTKMGVKNNVTASDYIRLVAISRIMLPNITNIQASWLTVGKEAAQVCLHAGANDFGSIMIEENVVSAAGSNYSLNKQTMQEAIKNAGFKAYLRNQKYEPA